jgi:hypothetical protein
MHYELKTVRWTCDDCKTVLVIQSMHHYDRPTGWEIREVRDCGSTGYTKYEDLCPACTLKEKTK